MTGTEKSNWVIQVNVALEREEANDAPSQLLIWKVPSEWRTNAEHYEPLYCRFGLHHFHESFHSDDFEGVKVEVARALQLTGDRWDSFCKRVVLEPEEYWKALYHHSPHVNLYTIEDIRCRLSLDALFLVVFLQHRFGRFLSFGPALRSVMRNPTWRTYINEMWEAFYLVENQISIQLLKRVVNILVIECKDNVGEMQEWKSKDWQARNIGACVMWNYFCDPLSDDTTIEEDLERKMINWLEHANSYHGVHILDSTYRMLCGWESLTTIYWKSCPPRYSATHLEACGVTIKGKEFTCFEDISYDKGCLSVPFLQVYDGTERYLRNFVVHESLTSRGGRGQCGAMCYTHFMGGLMRTSEDVLLLEKKGVLSVEVGTHDIVVDMWKCINCNIARPFITNNFFTMMTDVSNYTKRRRNKYGFEFKKQFYSRPWIPLSYLAATIVTIATLIQTYVAISGSNGMKPHFSP